MKDLVRKIGAYGVAVVAVTTIASFATITGWADQRYSPASLASTVEPLPDEVAALGERVTILTGTIARGDAEQAKMDTRQEDLGRRLVEAHAKLLVMEAEQRHLGTKLDGIGDVADRLLAIALDRRPPGPAAAKPPQKPPAPKVEPPPAEKADEVERKLDELLREYEEVPLSPSPPEPDPQPKR